MGTCVCGSENKAEQDNDLPEFWPQSERRRFRAVEDWIATNSTELDLNKGQIFTIVQVRPFYRFYSVKYVNI